MASAVGIQRALLLILVLLLVAIGALLVAGSHAQNGPAPASSSRFDGPTMPPGLQAANFSLRDQNGRTITLDAYRGRVIVLTFIHSRCHDTCPFMVEQIKGALNELPGLGRGLPAIGVSVAPAEDTPASRRWF